MGEAGVDIGERGWVDWTWRSGTAGDEEKSPPRRMKKRVMRENHGGRKSGMKGNGVEDIPTLRCVDKTWSSGETKAGRTGGAFGNNGSNKQGKEENGSRLC